MYDNINNDSIREIPSIDFGSINNPYDFTKLTPPEEDINYGNIDPTELDDSINEYGEIDRTKLPEQHIEVPFKTPEEVPTLVQEEKVPEVQEETKEEVKEEIKNPTINELEEFKELIENYVKAVQESDDLKNRLQNIENVKAVLETKIATNKYAYVFRGKLEEEDTKPKYF